DRLMNIATAAALISFSLLAFPQARADGPAVLLDATGFNTVLARADERLYISGQPTPEGFARLRKEGVTTVINLRTEPEMSALPFDEAATLADLSMDYVHLPSGGPDTPYAPATLERFADVLATAEGKVLLHCTVAWRASHLYAAYLYRHRGLSLEDAIARANGINFGGLPIEGFLGESLEVRAAQ
ncbi:MAG: protein tyrosine phosphatase family protein, partial [Pseudomonadales bacterium]|nr:protein tyrosine phosphatase family protein [Pseudomonadales bacterium]